MQLHIDVRWLIHGWSVLLCFHTTSTGKSTRYLSYLHHFWHMKLLTRDRTSHCGVSQLLCHTLKHYLISFFDCNDFLWRYGFPAMQIILKGLIKKSVSVIGIQLTHLDTGHMNFTDSPIAPLLESLSRVMFTGIRSATLRGRPVMGEGGRFGGACGGKCHKCRVRWRAVFFVA